MNTSNNNNNNNRLLPHIPYSQTCYITDFLIPKIKGDFSKSQNIFIDEFLSFKNYPISMDKYLSEKLIKELLFDMMNNPKEHYVIGEFRLTNNRKGFFTEIPDKIFETSPDVFNNYGSLFNAKPIKGKFKISYSSAENKLFILDFESLEFNINTPDFIDYRKSLTLEKWLKEIFSTIGLDYSCFLFREKIIILSRFLPLLVKNFSFIELGPKAVGKSHLYELFEENSIVKTSGPSLTPASIIYNNKDNSRGIIFDTDTLVFDEFNSQSLAIDTISELQVYLSSKKIRRGSTQQRPLDTSLVFLGNLIEKNPRTIFRKSSPSIIDKIKLGNDSVAMLHRINFLNPSWGMRKILSNQIFNKNHRNTTDYIPVSYISKLIKELRNIEFDSATYLAKYNYNLDLFSKRTSESIYNSFAGFLKLMFPHVAFNPTIELDSSEVDMMLFFAAEGRCIIENLLNKKNPTEFKKIEFNDILNGNSVSILKRSIQLLENTYLDFEFSSPHLISYYNISNSLEITKEKIALDSIGISEVFNENQKEVHQYKSLSTLKLIKNLYFDEFYNTIPTTCSKIETKNAFTQIFTQIETINLNHLYGYLFPVYPENRNYNILNCSNNSFFSNFKILTDDEVKNISLTPQDEPIPYGEIGVYIEPNNLINENSSFNKEKKIFVYDNSIYKNKNEISCPFCKDRDKNLKFLTSESFFCHECQKTYDSYTLKEIISN